MTKLLPFNNEINEFSNNQLLESYNNETVYRKMSYFPILALRVKDFEDLIKKELINPSNNSNNYRQINPAWVMLIGFLDYCEDESYKIEMVDHVKKNWSEDDLKDFKYYIRNEYKMMKYFKTAKH